MAFQIEDIKAEIERALQSLAEYLGDEFVAVIRRILYANLDRNRIQGFIEEDTSRVYEYVGKVVEKYKELSTFMNELQIERATRVWEPLLEQMQLWAYNYLIRKGFHKTISTQEIASECANEAALMIVDAHFPYDTGFDPWAHVIVQNACRRFIRDATKKSTVPQNNLVELDEMLSTIDDPVVVNQKHQEDKSDLLNAIAQLSNARRQVIELFYFSGFSLPEIASIMGKTIGAIHSLHFNALQDLRKILGANRNNL